MVILLLACFIGYDHGYHFTAITKGFSFGVQLAADS